MEEKVNPDSVVPGLAAVPQDYSHIRVAAIAYDTAPIGAPETDLLNSSTDLGIAEGGNDGNSQPAPMIPTIQTAAPGATQFHYSNLSNLYISNLNAGQTADITPARKRLTSLKRQRREFPSLALQACENISCRSNNDPLTDWDQYASQQARTRLTTRVGSPRRTRFHFVFSFHFIAFHSLHFTGFVSDTPQGEMQ